jgi:carbohydrate kinase (thermoresistant glucokinase family)
MTIMRMVVMGVSGCGKSSVGEEIARLTSAQFVDGDDLHPEANKAKMGAGIPLDDNDRWPWLDRVGEVLAGPKGAIVACSALKRVYRDRIRAAAPGTVFVHLDGSRELLWERISARQNHFMPASLLDSQLAILEPLGSDENGVTLPITASVKSLAMAAVAAVA